MFVTSDVYEIHLIVITLSWKNAERKMKKFKKPNKNLFGLGSKAL